MKSAFHTTFLVILLAGIASSARAQQGFIRFDNLSTNNGPVYYFNRLLDQDVNFELFGSGDSARRQPIHKWLLSDNSAKGINVAPGRFADPAGGAYAIPDTYPGTLAYLTIVAWTGDFRSFDEAVMAGQPAGSTVFVMYTGPAGAEPGLVYMPMFRIFAGVPVFDPQLRIVADTTGKLTISWELGILESAPGAQGPYAPVAGAPSPYLVPPASETARFYRVLTWPTSAESLPAPVADTSLEALNHR